MGGKLMLRKLLLFKSGTQPEFASYKGMMCDAHALVDSRREFVAKHAAAGPAWNAQGVPVTHFRLGASGAGVVSCIITERARNRHLILLSALQESKHSSR